MKSIFAKLRKLFISSSAPPVLQRETDYEFRLVDDVQFENKLGDGDVIELDGLVFDRFGWNSRRESFFCLSSDEKAVLKVVVVPNPRKANTLRQEADIIAHLNEHGSQTCPRLLGQGTFEAGFLPQAIRQTFPPEVDGSDEPAFDYLIQEYVPSGAEVPLADVLMVLFEQQKLGVFHGDLKPNNIRFDASRRLCYFIDYDQAKMLDEKVKALLPQPYLDWSLEQKVGESSANKLVLPEESVLKEEFFHGDAFNIASTSLYKGQQTTNTESGVYHSFDTPAIFAPGVRALGSREEVLDKIYVEEGETVLDVGCNGGLASVYMHDRGARVTGVDLDPCIIRAARIIATILGKKISYKVLDLDKERAYEPFDTVLLFSVIHHSQKMERNARMIAESSNRIIIESRLVERGRKPVGDVWIETSAWNYASLEEMERGLEKLFSPMRVRNVFGPGDKHRYIFELVKK